MILGWGKKVVNNDLQGVRERVGSSIQQKLALPVLSKLEYGRRFREPRPDQICAGGEEGKGFCAVSIPIVNSGIVKTFVLGGFRWPPLHEVCGRGHKAVCPF